MQNGVNINDDEIQSKTNILKPANSSVINSINHLNDKQSQSQQPHKMRKLTNQSNIRQLIYEKERDLDQICTQEITLKTEIETQILLNFQIETKQAKLLTLLQEIELQKTELDSYRENSIIELNKKFEVEHQEMVVSHTSRLNNLKEEVANKIEMMWGEKQRKYEEELQVLKNKIDILNGEKSGIMSEYETELNHLDKEHRKTRKIEIERLNQKIEQKTLELAELEKSLEKESSNLDDIRNSKLPSLQKEQIRFADLLEQLTNKNYDKQNDIGFLKKEIEQKQHQIYALNHADKTRDQKISQMRIEIDEMNQNFSNQENLRRQLHSKLQDLKGNIRVFCRIRWVSSTDLIDYSIIEDELNDESKQELILNNLEKNKSYKFSFDKIFNTMHNNKFIFDELSQLIQCSLDGQNVCVFAYGQTGSGKTYTMSNPQNGMIKLSIEKIFDNINQLKSQDWEYKLNGKFIEIYNETIIDLLNPDDETKKLKHEIKHDDVNFKTNITNVTTYPLESSREASVLFEQANKNRSTAATRINDRSSRSHSIFIIEINGKNLKTDATIESVLNLIDLAGSERLNVSKVEGERLKETQAINKSLSSLGDVIYSINSKNDHVPFRNSKLTYLLKNSLSGNSKTLMFVNISPVLRNFNETLNSLRFATKVNNTKI